MFNSRDAVDRQVIAAVREHDDLCRRRHTIIKLERPIQRGWRRLYVLSEPACERADRPVLEAILEVIGSTVVSHRRDFLRRQGRRRKFVEIEQPLQSLTTYEWERKAYWRWLSYFRLELVLAPNLHWQRRWVFTQPFLFELKTERNWQWYYREIDPAIETRLSELDRWLEAHSGWQRYGWLKGRTQHHRWRDEPSAKSKDLRREHRREIDRAFQIFPEVDPASLAQRIRISPWLFLFFPV